MKNTALIPPFECNADSVLALLGSFWSNTYSARDTLKRLIQANLEEFKQQHQDIEEAIACMSRHDVPLFHTENWLPIVLKDSEMQKGYGWELPKGVVGLPILQNRMTSPSLVWTAGVEYAVTSNMLVFSKDPFNSPFLPQASEGASTGAEDRSIVLWAFKAQIDRDYVARHFGYMLEHPKTPNLGYKQQINAIFDAMVAGTSTTALKNAIAMAHGIPVLKEPYETIEDSYTGRAGVVVVTDAHVYTLPEGCISAVYVGQRLSQGTPLVDACVVVDAEALSQLAPRYLVIPPELLPDGVKEPMLFENEYTRLQFDPPRFNIGGDAQDVACFLQNIDPERFDIATRDCGAFNPMHFVLQNCLRNNCLFIVRRRCCPDPLFPLKPFLRQIMPPQINILTVDSEE